MNATSCKPASTARRRVATACTAQAADVGVCEPGARLGRDAREQRLEARQVVEVVGTRLEVRETLHDGDGLLKLGRRLGGSSGSLPHLAHVRIAHRQPVLKQSKRGVGVGQFLEDRPSPIERRKGVREMARLILDRADSLIALCQLTLESSDRRVGVGELLRDRARLLERGECRGEVFRLLMNMADIDVALRQCALELSGRGVGLGQFHD